MSSGPAPIDRNPISRVACPVLVALLGVAALVLPPPDAPAQSFAGGRGAERRGFVPDAGGPERPDTVDALAELTRNRPRPPFAASSVSPAIKFQLKRAYRTALSTLRTEVGCRALFEGLGADGEALLAHTWYYAGTNSRHCQDSVPAFTTVGSAEIALCRSFADLQPSAAAVLLLHEALHSAGLRESPGYPAAPTSDQISLAVRQGCKLQ